MTELFPCVVDSVVDINDICTRNGAFCCKGCGQLLDPDDVTEKSYSIVEIEENERYIVIKCSCGVKTKLLLEP